jgi:hypothetical protein
MDLFMRDLSDGLEGKLSIQVLHIVSQTLLNKIRGILNIFMPAGDGFQIKDKHIFIAQVICVSYPEYLYIHKYTWYFGLSKLKRRGVGTA